MTLEERLARLDTSSLVDAGPDCRVLPRELRPIRRGQHLVGRAVTVDAREDLVSVLAGLAQSGAGDVLVIAVGGTDRAVAGELFATEALRRGLSGVVIDGLCRDSTTLAALALPVWSRGTAPSAYPARKPPVTQIPVQIGTVPVRPGDLLVGDDDGIVVASDAELSALIDAAEAIQNREDRLRRAIESGESIFDHLNLDDHVAALAAGADSKLTFS